VSKGAKVRGTRDRAEEPVLLKYKLKKKKKKKIVIIKKQINALDARSPLTHSAGEVGWRRRRRRRRKEGQWRDRTRPRGTTRIIGVCRSRRRSFTGSSRFGGLARCVEEVE
jgi:hypothetical protein